MKLMINDPINIKLRHNHSSIWIHDIPISNDDFPYNCSHADFNPHLGHTSPQFTIGCKPLLPVRAPSVFHALSHCIYDGPLSEGENRLSRHVGECPRGEAQSSVLQNKGCSGPRCRVRTP
ncbi:hypothetical protein CDAR_461931 [Caerostris darwini]|uniref:Uncharacterized protein n=1 Tax=Caerostris darwini TaxID=1538125 RepID=A0AAV4T8X1_9ARAC|nr:hypothetical protein CDAR_461931 [Caerostris darwini]